MTADIILLTEHVWLSRYDESATRQKLSEEVPSDGDDDDYDAEAEAEESGTPSRPSGWRTATRLAKQ